MSNQRGSALVLALVVVTTAALVAIAALELGSSAYRRAMNDTVLQTLRDVAEAGVSRARYEMIKQSTLSPGTLTGSAGGGTYSVVVTTLDANMGKVQIDSTATYLNKTLVVSRITGCGYHIARPFDYAIAKAGTDTDAFQIIAGWSGVNGDVRHNGSFRWTLTGYVHGDLLVQGTISGLMPVVSGSTKTGQPALFFPPIDYAYLKSIADTVYTEDQTFVNYTFPKANAIVYCTKALTISGKITGTGIFVVEGQTEIVDDITYANSSCKCAFMGTALRIEAAAGSVKGYLYFPLGTIRVDAYCAITGCAASLILDNRGNLWVQLDPTVRDDPDYGYNLHLPGY